MTLLHTVQRIYELQDVFYLLHYVGEVYCLLNLGRDRWYLERKFHNFFPSCILFSKFRTAEIFSSSNIIIYANIYIYIYIYIYILCS
jgi:hypothetical protein